MLFLFGCIVAGMIGYLVAQSYGKNSMLWGFICLFTGIFGLIVLIFIIVANKNGDDKKENELTRNVSGAAQDYTAGSVQDYTKTIELNPKDALAYYNRGCAKGKLGDFTGAIKDFNTVIELDSKNAEAYYNRGGAKTDLKDYTGAIKDFNIAIELDPKYAKAYYSRGCTKGKSGDRIGALEDLSRAGELGYSRAYEKIKEIQGQ